LELPDGNKASAIVFVANPDQALYEPDAAVPTVAQIESKEKGILGSNAEYVFCAQERHECTQDSGPSRQLGSP
jgi:cation transport protein ChaC